MDSRRWWNDPALEWQQLVLRASPVDFRLVKVKAVSANEDATAGFDFDTATGVILRWDGTEWIKQTIPQKGRLFDIAMPSPSEAWAVGENGVVLHWENEVSG